MTPSAPGYRRAGTRELQEESEKPEHEEEIGDVRVGKRANRGFQPAVGLGQEQEGKMKHVVTPGCCWIEYR